MFTRLILFTILLLCFNPLLAQKTSHNAFIKRVTKRMAYVGILKCEMVGRAAYIPPQYLRFDSLRKQCSNTELQALLKHHAPVVRAYAFQALAERPEVDLFPLLLLHRSDTATFAQQCGCIGSKNTVVDAMLSDYRPSPQYNRDKLVSYRQEVIDRLEMKSSSRSNRERQKWRHATSRQRFRLKRRYERATPQHDDNF